jgi:subtilisin family serine protease
MGRFFRVLLLSVLTLLGGCEATLVGTGLAAAVGLALALQGDKKEPKIQVSPSSLTFGDQVVVEASAPQVVTVTSAGDAALSVTGVSFTGAGATSFVAVNECGSSINPGLSCSIKVSFAPKATGAKSASLVVSSNAKTAAPPILLTGTGVLPPPPEVSPATLNVDILGIVETRASGQIIANDKYKLPLTFTVSTQAKQGTATITETTGGTSKYVFVVPGHLSGTSNVSDPFAVTVSNGYTSTTLNVAVTLKSDPLLKNQWHPHNTGQETFASTPPVAGNDMRVGPAWAAGYSGKGVKVAVIDDGVEAAHEDLNKNFEVSRSFNFVTQGNDPTPANSNSHGTKVAGIIASSAFNGRGGRGVAYGATIRGYNLLAPGASSQSSFVSSFGGSNVSNDNDVFNASLSYFYQQNGVAVLPSWDPLRGDVLANSLTLRGGRGSPIVQSAGNEFQNMNAGACASANSLGVSCGNVASDTMRASTNVIVVAASNSDGKKSSYSTTGSSVWISAPGGEYGYSNAFAAVPDFAYKPAIVTTARTGCDKSGFSSPVNALDALGANPLASQCQYTATMNGTSSAAPNLSAVIALMLEANPLLTFRDIKHILAKTAVRIDPDFDGVTSAMIIPGVTFALDLGWVKNAAGNWFSNWYGFGAVDAGAAVAAAKSYTAFLPAQKTTTQHSFAPTNDVTIAARSSYSIDFSVSNTMTVNEGVLLYVTFDTASVSCNQIELSSPSGTKSILLQGATGFRNAKLANTRFASNAFYGESVQGTWRATFHNLCNSGSTVLKSNYTQSLLVVGH